MSSYSKAIGQRASSSASASAASAAGVTTARQRAAAQKQAEAQATRETKREKDRATLLARIESAHAKGDTLLANALHTKLQTLDATPLRAPGRPKSAATVAKAATVKETKAANTAATRKAANTAATREAARTAAIDQALAHAAVDRAAQRVTEARQEAAQSQREFESRSSDRLSVLRDGGYAERMNEAAQRSLQDAEQRYAQAQSHLNNLTAASTPKAATAPKAAQPPLKAIARVDPVLLGPDRPLNPYVLKTMYGTSQLRQALDGRSLVALKQAVAAVQQRHPGTAPKNRTQKAALIDYITQYVSEQDQI